MKRFARTLLALTVLGGVSVACSDDPVSSDPSPLAGLVSRTGNDSLGTQLPGEPSAPEPGYFRGTVVGAWDPALGGDSLETSLRVPNTVVTAYRILSGQAPDYELDDAAATVTTDADGKFTLPELAAGSYVVTFNPPTTSLYSGVWVTAYTSAVSGEHRWWVTLPRK